jgi:hypothetical protein
MVGLPMEALESQKIDNGNTYATGAINYHAQSASR